MAQTQRQQLVRETALAEIQQEMVKSEQSVHMAELQANAQIKKATGQAESTRLQASGEAEAVRVIGEAKASTYRAGVEALGAQGYNAMQLMQIIGDHQVRLIPDVLVGGGSGNGNGLVDGLLSMILWNQTEKSGKSAKEEQFSKNNNNNNNNKAKPSISLAKTDPEESKALMPPSNSDMQNGSLSKTLIEPREPKV
jgi:uncharacterized membrane protein YqiK